jgi:hypothetical protein
LKKQKTYITDIEKLNILADAVELFILQPNDFNKLRMIQTLEKVKRTERKEGEKCHSGDLV